MNSRAQTEIQQLVEAALARYGTAGNVQVDGESVVLVGHGPTTTIVISHLLTKWDQLPFEERQRECSMLARSLSRQRRPVVATSARRPGRSFGLLGCGALVLVAAALWWKRSPEIQPTAAASPLPTLSEADRAERERRERADRVCNATRARVTRGATVGPTDAEGWVVELALLRATTDTPWASLAGFVSQGAHEEGERVVWTGAPDLNALEASGTRVVVSQTLVPELSPQFQSLVLTFHGEYVLSYFRERERIRLVRLSHALAEHQSATLGALYARCAERATHHLGSWFLGSSPGAAATSLLYFMGAHAEPPQLPREMLSDQIDEPLRPAFALSNLLEATRRLERQDVASLIGSADGMVAGPPQFTTLGFPFVESDRALRASLKVASAALRQ